jgi:hypothetical protein
MPHGFLESILQIHIVSSVFLDDRKWIFEGTNMFEFSFVLNLKVTLFCVLELLMISIFLK